MKNRTKLLALISIMALGLAACGVAGGTEGDPAPGQGIDVGEPNGDGASGTCLVGTPDCVDADLGDDPVPPAAGMCLPDHPGCVDTVVLPDQGADIEYRPIEPEGDVPGEGRVIGGGEVVSAEGNKVTVGFWMGIEDCYAVERVDVAETETKVAIDITVAEREVGAMCIELAEARSVTVELDSALGERIVEIGGVTINS